MAREISIQNTIACPMKTTFCTSNFIQNLQKVTFECDRHVSLLVLQFPFNFNPKHLQTICS